MTMSSYNKLLKVFKESILEEAGLTEDSRNDEYLFKNAFFNKEPRCFIPDYQKDPDKTFAHYNEYKDGVFTGLLLLTNSKIEYLPKDLKKIEGGIDLSNSNIKEIKDIQIISYDIKHDFCGGNTALGGLIARECKNLTKVDVEIKNEHVILLEDCTNLQSVKVKNGYNGYINLTNCSKLTTLELENCDYLNLEGCTSLKTFKLKKCNKLILTNTNNITLPEGFICKEVIIKDNSNVIVPESCDVNLKRPEKEKPLFKEITFSHMDKKLVTNDYLLNIDLTDVYRLDLSDTSVTELPNGLKVDNLILKNTKIAKLPDDLKVRLDLDISNTLITELPEGLNLMCLYLKDTKITKLPKDLHVELLHIENTPITELPEGLGTDSLILRNTKITKLPNDLKNFIQLYISNTPITELPDDLKVSNTLELSNTNITKLPKNLRAIHLDISNTPITELPEKKYFYDLDISKTPITELPEGLKVENELNISNTNITNLPKGLEVENELNISNTNITNLHDEVLFSGLKTLIANNSKLTEIKESRLENIYVSHSSITKIENTEWYRFSNDYKKIDGYGTVDISYNPIKILPQDFKVRNLLDITGTNIALLPDSLKSCHCIKGFKGNKFKYPGFHFDPKEDSLNDNPFDEDDI